MHALDHLRTRAFVSPSRHNPRGARPYIFEGEFDGDPIPGVIQRGHRYLAAVDAAVELYNTNQLALIKHPTVAPQIDVPLPDCLYPYQKEGTRFLAERDYAVLGDAMGIGKTIQSLAAAELRLQSSPMQVDDFCVLVVCPAVAKGHWQRQIKLWTGHDSIILDGLRPDSSFGLPPEEESAPRRARYVIVNYDILFGQRRRTATGKLEARDGLEGWGEVLAAVHFPIVILDEGHKVRSKDSRRSKALKVVTQHSTCVWALSGTISGGKVKDLFGPWDVVSGGLAGSYWPFVRAYADAHKGEYGWIADGRNESRMAELQRRMGHWFLARTKEQVGQQLPPKTREVVSVDVGDVKYDRHVGDNKFNVVGEALRKTAAAKLPAVTEMALEAIEAGQRVVVGVFLKAQAEEIAKRIAAKGHNVVLVNGEMSPQQRDIAARAFNTTTEPTAFVATIMSVVEAIDLTGADLQIIGDLTWDPTVMAQFEGRCHRVSSTKPILVRIVVAQGTLDEKVVDSIIGKIDTLTQLGLATASDKDLHERLGGEAAASTEAVLDELFKELTKGK